MSWSITCTITPDDEDPEATVMDACDIFRESHTIFPELDSAIEVAITSAMLLIDVVVKDLDVREGNIMISLNGHANPNNVAPAGMSSDYVTVSVHHSTPAQPLNQAAG